MAVDEERHAGAAGRRQGRIENRNRLRSEATARFFRCGRTRTWASRAAGGNARIGRACKVEVTNLDELSGPIKEMIASLQSGMEKMTAAMSQMQNQVNAASAKNGNTKCVGKRRGPARMPLKEAWRYLTIVQAWAGIQERNQKLPQRDRYQKVHFAKKHSISLKEVNGMLAWYRKYRNQEVFPKDPRTLSQGELKQWFE